MLVAQMINPDGYQGYLALNFVMSISENPDAISNDRHSSDV